MTPGFRLTRAPLLAGVLCLMGICAMAPFAGAVTHIVQVNDNFFSPANLTINPGDVVRWEYNGGGVSFHTTTSGSPPGGDGLWNASINAGSPSFQRTFNSVGNFAYFCAFHFGIGMTGTITVQGPNQPPVVTNPGTQNGNILVFFTVTVSATDPDGDPLTMTDLGTTPAWAGFVDNGNNTATISGTPGSLDAGTYPQSVRANDGSLSDTETFDIVIGGGPNQPPVVTNPGTRNGDEEVFFTVTVFASDPDGDPLTMGDLGTTPAWANFFDNGNNSATINGTPGLGDAATYSQSVTASDGTLLDAESFDIVIAPSPFTIVDITSGGWVPDTVAIDPGESIRWVKNAGGNHTTTSGTGGVPDGLWDAPLTNGSPTFERQFDTPGTFPYYCSNHTSHIGAIIVNDPIPTIDIQVVDFQFIPSDTTILVGQRIRWVLASAMVHTTTSGVSSDLAHNPGSLWDVQLDSTTTSFTYQFDDPGYFPFFCRPHELIDMRGTITVQETLTVGIGDVGTENLRLFPAPHPNPFATTVRLNFELERKGSVRIDIFDVNGRQVRNLLIGEFPAGESFTTWEGRTDLGRPVANGVYFARLKAEDRVAVQKVFKVK